MIRGVFLALPDADVMYILHNWLVVSIHFKNISQSSPNRGENKKYLSCHHPAK